MDEFPDFVGGDVRIVLTTARTYQLHAGILRNGSPLLRRLLAPASAAVLSRSALKAGATTLWKLMLVPAQQEGSALKYRLFPVVLGDRGVEVRGSSVGPIVENENGRISDPAFRAFDSILGALHGLPVKLGDAQEDNMEDLLRVALDVVEVADYLECIPVVTGPIEATLLAIGQGTYRAIAENPAGWLVFAGRIRSRAIFKEALIHAVGMYNSDKIQTVIHQGMLPDDICATVERKAQIVLNGVSETSRRLISFYPSSLKRQATVGRIDKDNTGRADYGNDIFAWMALTVFRHWLGDMMASDRTGHAKDMGFFFIKLISQGGNVYLNRTMMQQHFHADGMFPMSAKGMNVIEFRLTEIKENVKGYVRDYAKVTCQLDLHRFPVKHYTHIHVAPEDFPWHAAQIAARDADIDRAMRVNGGSEDDNEDETISENDEGQMDVEDQIDESDGFQDFDPRGNAEEAGEEEVEEDSDGDDDKIQ